MVRLAAAQGGTLLILTFAVERAQEVVLDLVRLMQANQVPMTDIHLDFPLAIRASRVFQQHAAALEDGQAMREALASARLHYALDGEASRRIGRLKGFISCSPAAACARPDASGSI